MPLRSAPAAAPQDASRDRRVLVAEDDPTVARMLASLLRSWGREPIVAADGSAALDAMTGGEAPPRALLDWMMPGVTGLDVLKAHRARGGRSHVVMLTARDGKEEIVQALEAGADDYVVKPFDAAELRARLLRLPRAPATSERPLGAGSIVGGRYRLETLLGEGGMGAVWRATHVELGHSVAIKLILPVHAHSPHARARFEAEAKMASQLRSPYLVAIFDYGITPGGTPYLVMEHLVGKNLHEMVEREGPLSPPLVAALASQLARGLEVVHAAGIVHRDIKPENVYLEDMGSDSFVGAPFRAKLLDFGIARGLATPSGEHQTAEGAFVGTLGYASPEQIIGEATPSGDIWSLGATLLYALTGHAPIREGHGAAMMVATALGQIALPSESGLALPTELDEWAMRACAVAPADRFPTPLALARALRPCVAGRGDSSWMSIVPPAPRGAAVTPPSGVRVEAAARPASEARPAARNDAPPRDSPLPAWVSPPASASASASEYATDPDVDERRSPTPASALSRAEQRRQRAHGPGGAPDPAAADATATLAADPASRAEIVTPVSAPRRRVEVYVAVAMVSFAAAWVLAHLSLL